MYSRRADGLENAIAVESWGMYGQALHKLCLVRADRFRHATNICSGFSSVLAGSKSTQLEGDSLAERCAWAINNPDLISFLHAVRFELLVVLVMSRIVPI